MKGWINKIVILLFVLNATLLNSQQRDLKIEYVGNEPIEIKAGEKITLSFKVTNNTNGKLTASFANILSPGLKLFLQNGAVEINPGGFYINLIGVLLPHNAYADTFYVKSKVKEQSQNFYSDSTVVRIFIKKNLAVLHKRVDKPEFITAGEQFSYKYQFTNRSNVDVNFYFSPSDEKMDISVDPETIYLRPGENTTLSVAGKTEATPGAEGSRQLPFKFNYIGKKNGDTLLRGSVTDYIQVFEEVEDDLYHKLPVWFTLRGIKETDYDLAYQVELAGRGKLFSGGEASIDFFARTPDVSKKTRLYYYRDEYRVGFHNRFLDVVLGDKSYNLTQLTENGRHGFGGEARVRISGFEVGGFQQRDRLYSSGYKGYATFLNYTFRDSLQEIGRLGVNFLNKDEINQSQIYSLTGNYRQYNIARLDFEYAQGSESGQSAYQVLISGSHKYFSYNAEYLHSSPNYAGSVANFDKISGGVRVMPVTNLTLSAGYSQNKYNVDNNIALGAAPINKTISAGVSYSIPLLNLSVSVSAFQYNWKDELSVVNYETDYNQLRSSINYRIRAFNAGVYAEFNDIETGYDYSTYKFERYGAQAGVLLFEKHRLDLSADYYHNNLAYYNNTSLLTAAARLMLQISSTTRLNASFSTNDLLKDRSVIYGTNYSYANLRLEQYLFKSHILSVDFRTYMYSNKFLKDNNAVMVEYKIPLKIPVSKRSSMGVVYGRIYDAENPELGISGVTLYADGKTAVSDSRGNYKFEDMKPDIYYLELNRLTLDRGKTTVQKTPIEIKLKIGEEVKADIGVIRSAAITGKVMLYDFEERKTLDTTRQKIIESYGLPDFQIYVRNGRPDIYSATTDSRGKFDFHDLPPGHWVVKIIEGQYPDYHYLEMDSVSFNLAAGEKKDVIIRVLPRVRPIKIAVITDTIRTEEEIKPTVEVVPKVPLSVGVPRRFSYDGWTDSLDAITRSYLDDVAQYISDNRNFIVRIEGHTDPAGGIVVTQQTSVQKAQLVRDYLTSKGVPSGNILTQGFGSRRPIAPNTTAQGRARNRRVEITIQRR